jgi:hypothetical protein
MATTDVFNNSNNNYVNPGFSPCVGAGDDSFLEFLPNKSIAVINGSNTLAGISFSDIQIPVSAYSSQKKILEPGEVSFIPGLSKGLNYRSQYFTLPEFDEDPGGLQPYYMVMDISLAFYKNFGYKIYNLHAAADVSNNININEALDIALSNLQAKITSTYDPSDMGFIGTQLGWDFNISNAKLTLIDASENPGSPFPSIIIDGVNVPQSFSLEEDLEKMVLYAKYPNSAMQGIILKATYPEEEADPDKWFEINHVPDIVAIYEPIEINNSISALDLEINFDPSILFGPFITDFSGATYNIDISNGSGSYVAGVVDSSFAFYDLSNSKVYGSNMSLSSTFMNGILENSWVNKDYPLLPYGSPSSRVGINLSTINECSIYNASIVDTSVFKSLLTDVSISNCTLYNCSYDPSLISLDNCTIIRINESIEPSAAYDSSIYYRPNIKTIEVGMSGCSTSSAMSAGDYLEWITTNDAWERVGDMYIRTSAPDAEDTRNLIDGFYAFNPQSFSIQLEYLIFV